MHNKLLISIFLTCFLFFTNTQFAFAGPTHVNMKVDKKCGTFKTIKHNHCPEFKRSGRTAWYKCVGGGNGKSNFAIETQSCGKCVVGTSWGGGNSQHRAWVGNAYVSNKGVCEVLSAKCGNKTNGACSNNTWNFQIRPR